MRALTSQLPSEFWQEVTGLARDQFRQPTLKRHNPKTIRKNTGDDYHGCLVINVRRSAWLYRQIEGWACHAGDGQEVQVSGLTDESHFCSRVKDLNLVARTKIRCPARLDDAGKVRCCGTATDHLGTVLSDSRSGLAWWHRVTMGCHESAGRPACGHCRRLSRVCGTIVGKRRTRVR